MKESEYLITEITYQGERAIESGWDSVAGSKNQFRNLLEVELPVLSNDECKDTKCELSKAGDEM